MSRAVISLWRKSDREAALWLSRAPLGMTVEFRQATRSLEQNARLWAMLGDLSEQAVHQCCAPSRRHAIRECQIWQAVVLMRRRIGTKERLAIFLGAGGICHICGLRIEAGQGFDVEHIIPLAQGGDDHGANLQPAHVKCHRAKTAKDAGDTSRAKRREARHIGARKSKTPMPFGRNSKLKRKLNGTIVKRGEG